MPSKRIPFGWRDYAPMNNIIEGTPFLPFKVPLTFASVPIDCRFNFNDLYRKAETIGLIDNKRIGLIVDLTFTTRYYNFKKEVIDKNIEYAKIPMSGGNSAPSESDFKIFARIVDRFLLKNPNGTIGVHCTHGLNRTGYMICRYMMEKWAISADDAIGRFESGRGYKITREHLVAALRLIERRQMQERSFSYSFD